MDQRHVIVIGGGLAGLSAGCYARASGFRTTIIEHNLTLGGVCTAWTRGPYTIDGCIHWLTGGPFTRIYEELDIVPLVPLRPIHHLSTYRDARAGLEVRITKDLPALAAVLTEIAPEDRGEIARLIEAAAAFAMEPPIEHPQELLTMRDGLASLWAMRHQLGAMVHFRAPIAVWAQERLRSPRLRRLFSCLLPEHVPAMVLLFQLAYLSRGYLSRPEGGSARFRDALVSTYERLGGKVELHTTVDEILVEAGRACGVRLADGTILRGDIVISTASAPETVLRLLGGGYGGDELRQRMERWRLFEPIVLASFGVATPLAEAPQMLMVDGIEPFEIGGRRNDQLHLRIYNDDSSLAPPGHTVVQTILGTDYGWWATRGARYGAEKEALAEAVLRQIDRQLPGTADAMRVADVATPLTYWNMARSWRGAYEGWEPGAEALFGHVKKTLPGLAGFYMAGQWVEPGGGVPTALVSGRQAVQLLCADEHRPFVPMAVRARAASPV